MNTNEYESTIIKDNKSNIENEVIHKEVKKEVNLAVSKLQDKFKLPIIMYYTADMSVEEISRALNIPKGTVKSRMHKARLLIKSDLEEIGYERI